MEECFTGLVANDISLDRFTRLHSMYISLCNNTSLTTRARATKWKLCATGNDNRCGDSSAIQLRFQCSLTDRSTLDNELLYQRLPNHIM